MKLKKIFALLLVFAMALSLAGCSGSENLDSVGDDTGTVKIRIPMILIRLKILMHLIRRRILEMMVRPSQMSLKRRASP